MQKRIKALIKRHFQNNFILYFLLFVIFIVGIVIGAILINMLETQQNYNIVGYFSWILEGERLPINILKSSLFSNIKFSFIIWLSGFIFLGIIIIPLIIGLKGLSIGFVVGFVVKEFGIKGFVFAILGLLPYYLIILPGILAVGSLGLSSSIASSRGRGKSLYKGNQNYLIDYSILIILFFIIISIGSFVESFVTPFFLKLTKFNL